jgi:hypothetical protein
MVEHNSSSSDGPTRQDGTFLKGDDGDLRASNLQYRGPSSSVKSSRTIAKKLCPILIKAWIGVFFAPSGHRE